MGRRDLARWLERAEEDASIQARRPHTDGVTSFSASFSAPISKAGLATWLSMLASFKGLQLLRVKGIVSVAGEPYAVDVVQSVVHAPRKLDAWPTADERTRLVFIVRELTPEAIEKTFSAFAMGESLPGTRRFDPSAYARFRKVADQFIALEDVTAPPPPGRPSVAK
jgi:G3E family GTPase